MEQGQPRPTKETRAPRRALLAILLVTVIWGWTFVFARRNAGIDRASDDDYRNDHRAEHRNDNGGEGQPLLTAVPMP